MSAIRDDASDRLRRIRALLIRLRAETADAKEEARVVSESMREYSREVSNISAFKKRSAELRRTSSAQRTTRAR